MNGLYDNVDTAAH